MYETFCPPTHNTARPTCCCAVEYIRLSDVKRAAQNRALLWKMTYKDVVPSNTLDFLTPYIHTCYRMAKNAELAFSLVHRPRRALFWTALSRKETRPLRHVVHSNTQDCITPYTNLCDLYRSFSTKEPYSERLFFEKRSALWGVLCSRIHETVWHFTHTCAI